MNRHGVAPILPLPDADDRVYGLVKRRWECCPPGIAAVITADLEAALEQFATITEDLK